jgi:hypothetical protein
MTRAAFLAGVSVGILVCLWWIARSIATAAEEERPYVPQDVYVEQLADILRREAW